MLNLLSTVLLCAIPTVPPRMITVLLPTRNSPENLLQAVRSLLNSALHPASIEVLLLVDDDDALSRGALATLQAEFSSSVRIDSRPSRGYFGIGPRLNAAAALSRGDWIYFIDDDYLMLTDHWDERIRIGCPERLAVCYTREANAWGFAHPMITRALYATLGHFSPQPINDVYWRVVGSGVSILRRVDDILVAELKPPDDPNCAMNGSSHLGCLSPNASDRTTDPNTTARRREELKQRDEGRQKRARAGFSAWANFSSYGYGSIEDLFAREDDAMAKIRQHPAYRPLCNLTMDQVGQQHRVHRATASTVCYPYEPRGVPAGTNEVREMAPRNQQDGVWAAPFRYNWRMLIAAHRPSTPATRPTPAARPKAATAASHTSLTSAAAVAQARAEYQKAAAQARATGQEMPLKFRPQGRTASRTG